MRAHPHRRPPSRPHALGRPLLERPSSKDSASVDEMGGREAAGGDLAIGSYLVARRRFISTDLFVDLRHISPALGGTDTLVSSSVRAATIEVMTHPGTIDEFAVLNSPWWREVPVDFRSDRSPTSPRPEITGGRRRRAGSSSADPGTTESSSPHVPACRLARQHGTGSIRSPGRRQLLHVCGIREHPSERSR